MANGVKAAVARALGAPGRLAHAAGSNFSYSFMMLPAARRRAIRDVYAFCRALDDVVDQDHTGRDPQAELFAWREEIEACYAGRPDTELGDRLLDAIEEFAIPKQPFLDIIDGMEMDLQWHSYQTFADLREYCYRVASAVGLICIEIFGYESPRAREYAVNLGLALQLTNIMRDLREDLARGRIYIPLEDLERFGYSERDLHAHRYNAPFIELMKFQHDRARYYFERAANSLPAGDRHALFAAEIMKTIYRELLDGIAAAQFHVYRHHVTVSRARRMYIALDLWARSKIGR